MRNVGLEGNDRGRRKVLWWNWRVRGPNFLSLIFSRFVDVEYSSSFQVDLEQRPDSTYLSGVTSDLLFSTLLRKRTSNPRTETYTPHLTSVSTVCTRSHGKGLVHPRKGPPVHSQDLRSCIPEGESRDNKTSVGGLTYQGIFRTH